MRTTAPLPCYHASLNLQRYDVLSTGMGALVVTSYCVLRGQDTGTALSLTIGSTVLALVVNELMGSDGPQ